MLDYCENSALRAELAEHFRNHPFTVVQDLFDEGQYWDGEADPVTGEIRLSSRVADRPAGYVLHTYLHELAHIIAPEGHTLDFALLAAGLQRHFNCSDDSPWRVRYDTHETPRHERGSPDFQAVFAGRVPEITDVDAWRERQRERNHRSFLEKNLYPALVGIVVFSFVIACYLAWPLLIPLFSNQFLTFGVGFLVAVSAIFAGLKC